MTEGDAVRPMRPLDAVAVGFGRYRSAAAEATAHTWPRTPPESRQPTWLGLLSDLVLPASSRQIGVASEGGRVTGIVYARSRASGLLWDVEHLSGSSVSIGVKLLHWVSERVLRAGARRLLIDTAVDGLGADIAGRARFEQYADGVTYRLEPGFSQGPADELPSRPRLRSDESGLYQLYNAAVPANVRAAEAMTVEEWSALYQGKKLWKPSVLGDRQDYVWEMGAHVAGWMRVTFGRRSQSLEIGVHPMYEAYAEKMVRGALTQMSPKAPVLVDVREYQGAVRTALERLGFQAGEPYLVWARQLAARVTQPSLAAAPSPLTPSV